AGAAGNRERWIDVLRVYRHPAVQIRLGTSKQYSLGGNDGALVLLHRRSTLATKRRDQPVDGGTGTLRTDAGLIATAGFQPPVRILAIRGSDSQTVPIRFHRNRALRPPDHHIASSQRRDRSCSPVAKLDECIRKPGIAVEEGALRLH